MQNALKKKMTYIIAVSLIILSIGGSFLIYGISVWVGATPLPYYIPLIIFGFLYGFLAYLSGDILILKYRRKVKEINPVLPEEEEDKVWLARAPFIIALIVTILVLGVLFIIAQGLGSWPLLS